MNEKYSALFTPWKIGSVEIKNRIVQPAMGGTSLFGWLEPCHFDREAAYHILNRAQNNVGLVLPGMQCVRDTMGGRWLYQNKKMFKDLAEWLPEFHKTGSKLFVQLSAGMGRSMAINELMVKMLQNKAFGALSKPILDISYITASASATPNRWYPECKSRPLTVDEIHEMVDAFAKTAKLLQEAGVDGVEIHAVHEGYLLDQFTIANMNYRTDEYGGSAENRARFAVEAVRAVRAAEAVAASHVEVQTGTLPADVPGKAAVAGGQAQRGADRVQREARFVAASEGTEILRPVVCGTVHQREPGVRLGGEPHEGIALVVFQENVIARLVPFDEGVFQHQSLELGADDDRVEPVHVGHHHFRFFVVGGGVLKILADAVFQLLRLAHVDDLTGLVHHQIDAWQQRQLVCLGAQLVSCHGGHLPSMLGTV